MERDERLFIDGTKARALNMIRCGAWAGVDDGRLESWFNQFVARQKELLGACLLDNFIFRGKGQVEALLKAALCSPAMLTPAAKWDGEIVEALGNRRVDPGIRLAPVIRLDQPPTKSGTYVLRRLAKSLRIQDKWMLWPQSLAAAMTEGVHTVVLVDDFCGSGKQFSDFVKETGLAGVMRSWPNCRFVYLSVAAHAEGIQKVQDDFPRVEFIPGEVLTSQHSFFGGELLARIKVDGIEARLKTDYDAIAKEVGLGGKLGHYGFGNQGLTYAFDHGTPNNTLPIYWYAGEDWTPLVNR